MKKTLVQMGKEEERWEDNEKVIAATMLCKAQRTKLSYHKRGETSTGEQWRRRPPVQGRENLPVVSQVLAQLHMTLPHLVSSSQSSKAREKYGEQASISSPELNCLRSQTVTSNPAARMGLRRRPFAFTEQGVSPPCGAIQENINRPPCAAPPGVVAKRPGPSGRKS